MVKTSTILVNMVVLLAVCVIVQVFVALAVVVRSVFHWMIRWRESLAFDKVIWNSNLLPAAFAKGRVC